MRFPAVTGSLFRRCVCAMIGVFAISLFAGALTTPGTRVTPTAVRRSVDSLTENKSSAIRHIIRQNLTVLFVEWAGAVTAGFTSILQVAWNGFRAGLLLRQYELGTFLALVVPHAIFEFSGLLIGASLTLEVVIRTVNDTIRGERDLALILRESLPKAILCVSLILIAGVIEVYLTPIIGYHYIR